MSITFWPFSRKNAQETPTKIVSARFIRTDTPSRGDLRLRSPLCRLGRAPDNDLCFENDSVSGHHAEIYHLPDGTFQMRDLDSTNGTWISGQRIQVHMLKNGDIVEMGEVRLHFRLGEK